MEKMPTQEKVMDQTEVMPNKQDTQKIAEQAENGHDSALEAITKENKKAAEADKIDEVKKGIFARMGATLKNTYEGLTGETEKRDKRAQRLGVGHFKTEYETLMKTDSERAAKYKKAVENMPTFQYDEKLKDYVDVTKYAVASGEGTSGK